MSGTQPFTQLRLYLAQNPSAEIREGWGDTGREVLCVKAHPAARFGSEHFSNCVLYFSKSSVVNAGLTCERLWVPSPLPQKKKKNLERICVLLLTFT
jgi:hypothetical protein